MLSSCCVVLLSSRYYACSSGVTTRMQCPSGLLFNSKIGSCDLADHVSCKLDVSIGRHCDLMVFALRI